MTCKTDRQDSNNRQESVRKKNKKTLPFNRPDHFFAHCKTTVNNGEKQIKKTPSS